MEKRVVIFILLSIAIFILWQHFIITPKLEEQKKAQEKIIAQQKLNKKENDKSPIKSVEPNISKSNAESVEILREKGLIKQTKNVTERKIEVNTPLYSAIFSNIGGVLTSFRLKEHWDIQTDPDKVDNKLLIENELEKNVSQNLKTIYSNPQLVNDYISLRKLIDQIEDKFTDEIPDDSSFRESLMSFVSNTAGKTPKKIKEELLAIQSYLSSKMILEDIAERREKVKKILGEIKNAGKPSSELLDRLKIESGVDMVSAVSRKIKDYPFNINDPKGVFDLNNIGFETDSPDSIKINEGKQNYKLKFVSSVDQNNEIVIIKEFQFYPDSYLFDMQFTVVNNSTKNLDLGELSCEWGPGITFMNGSVTKKYTHEGSLTGMYGSIKKDLRGSLQSAWAAIEDSFFVVSLFNENNISKFYMNPGLSIPSMSMISTKELINPGSSHTFKLRCYCGPKQISYLRKTGIKLENIVDYGWFSFIAVPLLEGMKFLYKYIPNYGWVIIIITIVIRILFFPLNAKSMKSMKKMQALQPKIKELKDKYKDDRQKMNIEMMALYKKYDVNPMGGCLPMLIQIPILFAFFRVLPITVEFRHQPFIFWIRDLTAKDPYYVTPILMGISMIYQQKMTPTSVDPKQAQIMMFMPIIFTFLFLNFSSGLVLYWLTSNILAIGQQYLMNRNSQTENKGHKK